MTRHGLIDEPPEAPANEGDREVKPSWIAARQARTNLRSEDASRVFIGEALRWIPQGRMDRAHYSEIGPSRR